MYISCPKCSTSYTIDGRNVDSGGRKVRCFKCGQAWLQHPEPVLQSAPTRSEQTPEPALEQQQKATASDHHPQHFGSGYPPLPLNTDPGSAAPYPPYYPPPYPPYYPPPPPTTDPGSAAPYPPYYPPPYPDPPGATPVAEQSQLALEPETTTASTLQSDDLPSLVQSEETTPDPSESVDISSLPSEEELAEVLGDGNDVKPIESATSQPREDISELSEVDLENLEDPDPISGIGGDEKEEFEDADVDPEDLPDPEPLPVMGEENDTVEKKRSLKGVIISLIVVVLLGGIIAGLIVMRDTVASFWPGANGVLYDWMGLRVPQPGDGLELTLRSPQRETKDGKDLIVFEIIIQNTTDKTQRVPTVISSLIDAEGNQVQEITTTPSGPTLEAGKIMRFKALFPNAPAAAKQSLAKWGDYQNAGSESQAK